MSKLDFKVKVLPMKLSDLVSPEYNPRISVRDDEEFYDKLTRSIQKLGYIDPIIINVKGGKNTIVAGNQRFAILSDIARDKGISPEDVTVDVVCVDYDENMEMVANIAHNNIQGDWLTSKLREDLEILQSIDEELALLTGFDEEELANLLKDIDEDSSEKEENNDFCIKIFLPEEYSDFYDFYISLHSEEEFKKQVMKILTGPGNGKK
jgi:ParB-like chromosome segregation protein Spo0J